MHLTCSLIAASTYLRTNYLSLILLHISRIRLITPSNQKIGGKYTPLKTSITHIKYKYSSFIHLYSFSRSYADTDTSLTLLGQRHYGLANLFCMGSPSSHTRFPKCRIIKNILIHYVHYCLKEPIVASMAPPVGLEPTTLWLTARCSTC